MTVDEYLEHQPEEETADSKQISSILDSEMEVWLRVHWRLSEELFLFWYIWLKDNMGIVEEFVEGGEGNQFVCSGCIVSLDTDST
jgi:hypothetical protein